MILDASELESGAALETDLCIIGAGAAGIILALEFAGGGHSVIVLESGGEAPDSLADSLYQGEVADAALHAPTDTYRRRGLGGTTAIWGGRCMPFDAIDFERREWIAGSGWPFGIEALLPFYARANQLCEAGDFAYTAEAAFPRGMAPMLRRFRGRRFTDNTLERFSCPTHFGRRYRKRLAASPCMRVVLHATVTNIGTCRQGQLVEQADVRGPGGRAFAVRAKIFVLAMGGLEIPRLLLASRDVHAQGIGNAHDQVGRHYMCHMAGTIGAIRVEGGVSPGYQIADDGVYCRRRFALTGAAQRELLVGNFVARLHHPRIPDPSHRTGSLSALYLARRLIPHEYRKRLDGEARRPAAVHLAHLANVARDPVDTARFLAGWLRRRTLAERKLPSIVVKPKTGTYSIDFHAEQVPNARSRVCLAAARDAYGMQRILVDWRHSADDIRTVRTALAALAGELEASGCGRLVYAEAAVQAETLRHGAYGGHHIGTARMAADPRRGVVDADCRVHGMANLYLAGSAVFPTSGQANPTLTIVALALRLAQRLQNNLKE